MSLDALQEKQNEKRRTSMIYKLIDTGQKQA